MINPSYQLTRQRVNVIYEELTKKVNISLAGASRQAYLLYAIHVEVPCLRAPFIHGCNGQ